LAGGPGLDDGLRPDLGCPRSLAFGDRGWWAAAGPIHSRVAYLGAHERQAGPLSGNRGVSSPLAVIAVMHTCRRSWLWNSLQLRWGACAGASWSRSNWTVDRGVQPAANSYRGYAILARFTDINTGKPAIVVAGIGRGGTRGAGEFLTDKTDLAQLMRLTHAAGDKQNLEVVLSTQIIDGEPGSPMIEATYFRQGIDTAKAEIELRLERPISVQRPAGIRSPALVDSKNA
jgi:hypothetical protein